MTILLFLPIRLQTNKFTVKPGFIIVVHLAKLWNDDLSETRERFGTGHFFHLFTWTWLRDLHNMPVCFLSLVLILFFCRSVLHGKLFTMAHCSDFPPQTVEYVVFDEADRLFEMGYGEQLLEILKRLPDSRQTLLFSATLPKLLVDFTKVRSGIRCWNQEWSVWDVHFHWSILHFFLQ